MKKESNRRLVAIMFTDMVGYTALMQENEELGIQKRMRHRTVIEQQHELHHGEVIQYFGDGTLSIFSNSIDAVSCAINIQQSLKNPIEVPLRIGIHSGNVLIQEDGIIGDAVNIASRIESFANIGGVLISDAIQDQIKNQTKWGLVSLGTFNLKNVNRPFRIFAVDAVGLDVPDPNFLKGKGEKIANLKGDVPKTDTELLGRKKELRDIIGLLNQHRVVTVTGTGGMGKTRIVLEVCTLLKSEFKDGIAFISMATLTEGHEVMPRIAAMLDIKEAEGRDFIHGVAAIISDKKALLVLDNLEQVISAAKEISTLVSLCPNLTVLCTSRTPLKIKSEQEYALHPLELPEKFDIDTLMNSPAIKLFVQRAQKVNIDFELNEENAEAVLDICQRMDGLPLALELAAARIRILPPKKLLARLSRALDLLTTGDKDLPERHQTLRTTIDWSHNLLSDGEKQLFRRLGVFASGFTLDAIEEICYENEDDAMTAMDELESLLDKALVEKIDGGSRFTLLQTIKSFALEQLKIHDTCDTYFDKHAQYFYKIAQILKKGTQGEQQNTRLKQGSNEDANIQLALEHSLKLAKSGNETIRELGLLICGELFMYWHIRGKHYTAKKYIIGLLNATDDQTPSLGKCRALFHLQVATFSLGELDESRQVADQNYKMASVLNDDLEMAKACFSMGFGHLLIDLPTAKKYSDEGVVLFRKLNNKSWMAWILWQNALVNLIGGDLTKSKERYSESYSIFKKLQDNEGIGCSQSGIAMLEFIHGNFDQAIEQYQGALTAYQIVGDRPEEARVLSEIAWTYLAKGNTLAARKYTLGSIQAYQEVGSTRGIGLAMNGLAAIEAVEGRPKLAVEIAAAADYFAEQEGIVIEYGANNHGVVYLDQAKKELTTAEIELAQSTGMNLTLKQVIALTENDVVWVT